MLGKQTDYKTKEWPIPDLQEVTRAAEIVPKDSKTILDRAVDSLKDNSTSNLILGTITGRPRTPSEEPRPAEIQKPEPFKPEEYYERPFYPTKPIPYTPIIAPSSIPNPNPSVAAGRDFPHYMGYLQHTALYNVPGYSAFQPVSTHPPPVPTPTATPTPTPTTTPAPAPMLTPTPTPMEIDTTKSDYIPFILTGPREPVEPEKPFREVPNEGKEQTEEKVDDTKKQQDFEDNFTMQIIPPTTKPDITTHLLESTMSIASIAQGSGGSVIIPSQINQEVKKKLERFSLKTSIPISKIEMKSVTSPVETTFYNAAKKPVFNPAFTEDVERPKVEIQSNILIKTATITKDADVKDKPIITERESLRNIKHSPVVPPQKHSINTLHNFSKEADVRDKPIMAERECLRNNKHSPVAPPQKQNISTLHNFTKEADVKDKLIMAERESLRNIKHSPVVPPQKHNISTLHNFTKEADVKDKPIMAERESLRNIKHSPAVLPQKRNISTLHNMNAAESVKNNNGQFRVPEPKSDVLKEAKDPPVSQPTVQRPLFNLKDKPPAENPAAINQRPMFKPAKPAITEENKPDMTMFARRKMFVPARMFTPKLEPVKPNPTQSPTIQRPAFHSVRGEIKTTTTTTSSSPITRPTFTPVSTDSKPNFPKKPPDRGFNEQKRRSLLNHKNQNPKRLSIQPNPQVLLQRTNFESKNLQTPSRLSSQSKKNEVVPDTSSKVVALKRLHQDNGDENDFENLITENQIYGNKIVVKEKSQLSQEEWKTKPKMEKPVEQHWKKKYKTDLKLEKPPETKNVVLQPNKIVYLTNMQYSGNLMMIKNASQICHTTDSNKMKVSPIENITTEEKVTNNNNVDTSTEKSSKAHSLCNKEVHVLKSCINVLQTLTNNNNKTDVVFQSNPKVIAPQVVLQVPIAVTEPDNNNHILKETKIQKEISTQVDTKPDKVIIIDAKVPKIVISNLNPKVTISAKILDEISTLDVYEQKKRLRRLRYLSHTTREVPNPDQSPTAKKVLTKTDLDVITADKVRSEIYRELSHTKRESEGSGESGSDSDYEELDVYNAIIDKYGPHRNENAKADFLAGFSLATREVYRDKRLERHERTLRCDAVASAHLAAARLAPEAEPPEAPERPRPVQWSSQNKSQFLSQFHLMQVSQRYKADYEKSWQEILQERNRRNGIANPPEAFDTDSQLQMLTEINKSVNENNDLIKKRLDSFCDEHSDIRILAEKNFSELNRLSKMADRSVKLFSGKDSRKRDLNPGFDSENIKKLEVDENDHLRIVIPDISKIISLKSDCVSCVPSSCQATSMDEPRQGARHAVTCDAGCQADEKVAWTGALDRMDQFIKQYREYEIGRKKEMDELHRKNTVLRVESALVTRAASRDSDRASALLAERAHLARDHAALSASLDALRAAVQAIRNA